MRREIVSRFSQSAQVDNPLEPGGIGGGNEVPGGAQIAFDIASVVGDVAPTHGVDQVVGNFHPGHGSLKAFRLEHIALGDLYAGDLGTAPGKTLRGTHQATEGNPLFSQDSQESAPDKACRSCEEHSLVSSPCSWLHPMSR